jgi:hypothetical protein
MYASNQPNELIVDCPLCGKYSLVGPEVVGATYQWTPDMRLPLSCATRQAFENNHSLQLTIDNVESYAAAHRNTRVSDNLNRLLQITAERAGRPNQGARFSTDDDFTLIDSYSREEFDWYIEWLKRDNLVYQTGAGLYSAQLTLSVAGWNRVQPLSTIGGTPGHCFVAMWFAPELQIVYDNGIALGISDAGFKPIRIDAKEHNNEIPDEIIAEIRNSEFMVADFTGQRAGVYYEAGFAMGLGRKVIWCCREDEISKLHFDTSHKNHIGWKTPEELRTRLYKRIRATILESK